MTVNFFRASPNWLWHTWGLGGLLMGLLSICGPMDTAIAMTQPVPKVSKPCALPSASLSPTSTQSSCAHRPVRLEFATSAPASVGAENATVTATPAGPENNAASSAAISQLAAPDDTVPPASSVQQVDVDPAIIEGSPVLQRWLEEVPDLAVDNDHDPAFRTRVRVGYAEFPSTNNTAGVYIGVQDVFVGRTPLTLSAEYATNSRGDRQTIGADAQYYLLPLGWYGNVAPVIGYRDIQTPTFDSEGLNLGLRIVFIPSRTGTADLSLTQSWVAPGSDQEVGLTTFTAGYAIAEDLRIGTDIQIQNGRDRQESRVGVLLEWML